MLKTRDKFERVYSMIPPGTVSKETASILKAFRAFFLATDAPRITHAEFWPFFRSRYPNWPEKEVKFWHAATAPIDKDNPAGLDDNVIRNLLSADLGNKLLKGVEAWNAGEEVELAETARAAVDQFDAAVERRVRTASIELGWEEMVHEESNEVGLRWRLDCLNSSMRPLRVGDFGIVAMRPDRGKTTMLASEITYMAPQLGTLFPDEKRIVLHLNNEGLGRRIVSRYRQAALGMSLSEIVALKPGEAQRRYTEAMGGREDLIQVKDIHGFASFEVEELIRKVRPGLVIFDMIDGIRFAGGTTNGGDRTDQLLESMYQWARILAVRYEFVALATSQISAEGDGMRYPTQPMLKDSRTGKQGAVDFIITGGYDPAMPNTRFIGMTKNKVKREGGRVSPDCQVMFDADRARLSMPTMTED